MSEKQPNPAEFSSFTDWCLHKYSLSEAARYTVEVLLKKAGTSDIYEANQILSSSNKLALYYNQISDITPLQSLTNLTELNLDNNQISDITPLQSLTNLTKLALYNNQISDITPLQSLTNLTSLHLSKNPISDITPLQSLTNLTKLALYNNQISDITLLQSLTNLAYLYIFNNQISDITPLQSLTNLTSLNVNFKPEHKALIEACRQKWGTLVNSTEPISNPKAAAAVKSVCEILGLKASEITFCSSPNGGVAQIPLKRSNDTDLIKRLKKRVEDALHPFFLITELRQELSELSIWEEQLEQQFNTDFANYWKYSKSIFTPKYLVEALGVAEFCVSLGIIIKPEAQKLFECLNQLLAECGWIILLDDTCIVCSRPCQLSLDSEYRLHAEGEPALEFPDGYKIYSYHGVTLPEKYGHIHPNLWQAQWLLEEDNAELRRVLIQGIGYARICSELQATELDCWKEYTLLKIDADIDGFDPNDFDGDDDAPKKEDIYLLKMICPSTGHIHALRVPPDVTSAKEAIRWVNWDIDSEEFSVQT
ncbi:leucine-rich repeat domain-containing protein [Tychonema sp. LEGE 07199]|uniref:leucine-rich repeat domain-containing protein n=1 Tax=unclassified Tychonema TaxID=2642144 RepID=UPI00187F365E|nr:MULTISPECIES: leucine-rich repeat domain-containing protein [unclassified Tychonema]MBE9121910.1 leucine-rich repeat domain-containing protein [Tychonema sp. LEGE 07199]MBE9133799.1 leucine-rich repeat domain-containing protein [Tychonema sp. LEGE 07196]